MKRTVFIFLLYYCLCLSILTSQRDGIVPTLIVGQRKPSIKLRIKPTKTLHTRHTFSPTSLYTSTALQSSKDFDNLLISLVEVSTIRLESGNIEKTVMKHEVSENNDSKTGLPSLFLLSTQFLTNYVDSSPYRGNVQSTKTSTPQREKTASRSRNQVSREETNTNVNPELQIEESSATDAFSNFIASIEVTDDNFKETTSLFMSEDKLIVYKNTNTTYMQFEDSETTTEFYNTSLATVFSNKSNKYQNMDKTPMDNVTENIRETGDNLSETISEKVDYVNERNSEVVENETEGVNNVIEILKGAVNNKTEKIIETAVNVTIINLETKSRSQLFTTTPSYDLFEIPSGITQISGSLNRSNNYHTVTFNKDQDRDTTLKYVEYNIMKLDEANLPNDTNVESLTEATYFYYDKNMSKNMIETTTEIKSDFEFEVETNSEYIPVSSVFEKTKIFNMNVKNHRNVSSLITGLSLSILFLLLLFIGIYVSYRRYYRQVFYTSVKPQSVSAEYFLRPAKPVIFDHEYL